MLRPGHRFLGGRHFDGDAAVRRRRLRASRKVIVAKNHKRKSRREDGQLDFAKITTKTEPNKGRRTSMQTVTPQGKNGRSSFGCLIWWMVNPSTVGLCNSDQGYTLKEASDEPITTCMTLRWYSLSLRVRLFFQFVFKVQYISTHRKTEKDGVNSYSGCCYMPYDFGLHQKVDIRVASHLTLMTVTVHWLIIECAHLAFARSLMGPVIQPFL